MSIEHLPVHESNSNRSVQVNENSDNIELSDITGKKSDDPPLSPNIYRKKAHIQFASLCLTLFLLGWNDGTTGPMLPRIQKVYHVRGPRIPGYKQSNVY